MDNTQPNSAPENNSQTPEINAVPQAQPAETPETAPPTPRNHTRLLVLVGIFVAVLALAGAAGLFLTDYFAKDTTNDSSVTTDDQTPEDVEEEIEGSVNVNTTNLPNNYPSYVPAAYPESTLVSSAATDAGRRMVFNATYSASATVPEIYEYYKDALVKAGFTLSLESISEDGALLSAKSKEGSHTISLAIIPDTEDATTVPYSLTISQPNEKEEQ